MSSGQGLKKGISAGSMTSLSVMKQEKKSYYLEGLEDTDNRNEKFILFSTNLPSKAAFSHTIVPAKRRVVNHL